jgi:hypothetical protein
LPQRVQLAFASRPGFYIHIQVARTVTVVGYERNEGDVISVLADTVAEAAPRWVRRAIGYASFESYYEKLASMSLMAEGTQKVKRIYFNGSFVGENRDPAILFTGRYVERYNPPAGVDEGWQSSHLIDSWTWLGERPVRPGAPPSVMLGLEEWSRWWSHGFIRDADGTIRSR